MEFRTILIAAAAIAVAAPAFAADASAPAPKPPSSSTSFSFEFGTEFKTTTNATADTYVKPSVSHTFANGVIWGGSLQQVWKDPNGQQELLESTLGYNFKIDPTFTVTSSAGVGYVWDSNPANAPAQDYAYYVANLGLNAKLAPQLTWTVISARYRQAFIGGWETPKLSTTLSYAWTPAASIFASYGYAWKNGAADKYSWAAGMKIAF
jgi:opacity protein-like surface antigen